MIVSHQAIRKARVSERQFAAGVKVAKQNVRHCLPTFVAGVVGHQHSARIVGDTIDSSWPALNEHQYDRFARCFDRFREFTLRLAQGEIGNIAGSLSVRSFAKTEHDHIGSAGGSHRGRNVDFSFHISRRVIR